ncbi:MAG: PQQ-dependent sugar dehydrogenase, partial [Acidobacteriota bacterium]|nr:PQQ-dependent sugar dehydrogenase [Acidobacteriota bacterium]
MIKIFDDLADATPTIFADLRTNVHNFWDRGLLGLALHPDFPNVPYVYVLYTHDAAIGGVAPRWGTTGGTSDPCPNPPGATGNGCVVSGRLSRLRAAGNVMTGVEEVLIEDWGQQYPSHSIGSLAFGADGKLYVSGGDGASFNQVDYGQFGEPVNPLGDPPAGVGGAQTPPTAEGGALRSQDLRSVGDPVTLDGTILRVDPETGAAPPDNPLSNNSDPNGRRVIAYGLRNPFRITVRPGTNEVWAGDVGWGGFEEINRIINPVDAVVENFGWPCYEGAGRQSGYDGANLNVCENLYGETNAVTAPFFAYSHGQPVVSGGTDSGGSSISGLSFYNSGNDGADYPAQYDGALFFADYSRNRIWVLFKGANGLPDPATRATFRSPAASPVELQTGPGGDLFYADFNGGTIRRIQYFHEYLGNEPPTAIAQANPRAGSAPLTVVFDATNSSDPNGDALAYAWDFDGDGIDDSTSTQPMHTYTATGSYNVQLKVTDGKGLSDVGVLVVTVGNSAPAATIDAPLPTLTWRVGDVIFFSGRALDTEDGTLAASALSWS